MKYTHFLPIFKGIISIILSLQNIASVQTANHQLRVNVTRQSDGDILVFDDEVDCASFNANCSHVPNNERRATKTYKCDSCKCLSGYNTYVLTENQCINTNEIRTIVNCDRIFRQKQVTVLTKSTRAINRRPIPAYRCEIKEQNPGFYLDNKGTHGPGTWIRMMHVNFSLRSRRYNWFVTFNDNAISKLLSKYAGRIVKLKLSCIMRRRPRGKQINLCVMFKIAGFITGVINSTHVKHLNGTYTSPSTQPRVDTTILYHTTNGHRTELPSVIKTSMSSENNHAQDQNSKSVKTTHTIWIIITVLIVIIIVLTGVVVLICFKKRKIERTTEEYQSRGIRAVHEYDVPMKSQDIHRGDPQRADHIYATISDMKNAVSATCSSSEYQELNPRDRDKDASHYQSLVRPSDLQYVDVLPHQAETNT